MSNGTRIILGRMTDVEGIAQRAREVGLDMTKTSDVLTVGVLDSGVVDEWVDLEPVAGSIILQAPEPHDGDVPGTWLHLEGDRHTNTSNLVALRIAQ